MPRINLLTATTLGVDSKTNPLFLGNKKLRWATNMSFEEGVIRTRPGLRYGPIIEQGQLQGAGEYRPSMGLSSAPFAEDFVGVVIVVGGDIFINCDKITTAPHFKLKGDVEVYQAENYLIFQNPESSTFWWDGTTLTQSPGMQEQDWNDPEMPRVELEIIRPVGQPGTCGVGGGGGGECIENRGVVTVNLIDNDTEAALSGVAYAFTVNGNIAYEGLASNNFELAMEEGVYDYTFTLEGYIIGTGSVSVMACSEQTINIRLNPTGESGGGACSYDVSITNHYKGNDSGIPIAEGFYLEFEVTNTSPDDLVVTDINTTGSMVFFFVVEATFPVTIPPEGAQTFLIWAIASGGNQPVDSKIEFAACSDYTIVWPLPPPTSDP